MLEPEIEIVGEAVDAVDTLLKIPTTNADVVVIDLPSSGKDAGLCSHILTEYPDVRVFAVSRGGNKIVVYETAVLRKETSSQSLDNLQDIIRSTCSLEDGWTHLSYPQRGSHD